METKKFSSSETQEQSVGGGGGGGGGEMARRKFSKTGEGAPSPVLENFRCAISTVDCPSVSEDGRFSDLVLLPQVCGVTCRTGDA